MQAIFNIAEICSLKGLTDCVLSPGSRCAPLTLAFARHPKIKTYTISDERSAAFIAIGISQQSRKTSILVCTSGSAAYNYAPAVSEAYYQQVPLLILTADRPPEWLDQQDGQTIRQNNIYGSHVKASYSLPSDVTHADSIWHIERTVSEAINTANSFPKGPVHINIPLREPFYPDSEIKFSPVKIIEESENERKISDNLRSKLKTKLTKYSKILIVAGQYSSSEELNASLGSFSSNLQAVLITDIISNCSNIENAITLHDLILANKDDNNEKDLKPELLISFGGSVISKGLKQFLRKNKPKEHWHIQEDGNVADGFQALTLIIRESPETFFTSIKETKNDSTFSDFWRIKNQEARQHICNFFKKDHPFSELEAIKILLDQLPYNSILHLSNSMPVRYANYLNLNNNKEIKVFANRGTSGIDGVISTAVGAALATTKTVTIITGDMAFFYDRNAFWNKYLPPNLRILILNNHGGGIFRMIEGPNRQPELEEYFETKQPLIAVGLAHEYELEYYFCKDQDAFLKYIPRFFENSTQAKILEVESESIVNAEIFNNFKKIKNIKS